MLMALSGPSRAPVGGNKPVRLVILLHGRGSDGEDLLDLQRFWGPLVPEAEFISPNAPLPSEVAPRGHQWFNVQDRNPAAVLTGVRATAPSLDAFISEELQRRGLSESDAALVGFSQGTMMALHVGLRRERPLAGIIGYSGRLIASHLLAEELRSRPPVLLVHGTADSRVPFQSMTEAEMALRARRAYCSHSDGDGFKGRGRRRKRSRLIGRPAPRSSRRRCSRAIDRDRVSYSNPHSRPIRAPDRAGRARQNWPDRNCRARAWRPCVFRAADRCSRDRCETTSCHADGPGARRLVVADEVGHRARAAGPGAGPR
jgi:phospholipase/carboxylesterase